MAEVRWEGECCECCALVIANGDDSGCRDYYGHTHSGPRLTERALRALRELYPEFADSEIPWEAWLVIADEVDEETGESEGISDMYGCDLCERDGYMTGHRFVVIR